MNDNTPASFFSSCSLLALSSSQQHREQSLEISILKLSFRRLSEEKGWSVVFILDSLLEI
jgi:hypothetical protein